MKDKVYSPYATNKGGKIDAPKGKTKDDPRSTRTVGNDLRAKRGKA
jgi:hypothetical protein